MATETIPSVTATAEPGELRPGWRMVKFGDVVRNVDVAERNPLEKGLERYVGLEHLDPESLHIRRWGLIEDGTSFTRRFSEGQVLFGKRRAYQRKAAVAEWDGICSGDMLVFESKDELLPELLPFIVQSDGFFQHALGTSAGSLSPRTRWRDLEQYEFALPPKDEQRRIAEILWAADEVVEARRKLTATLPAVRQASLDQILLCSGSNRAQTSAPLGELCAMQNGRAFPSASYRSGGMRLLRPGNLGSNGYFKWDWQATQFLPPKFEEIASDYIVRPGDVVINLTAQSLEDGFMGRVCMARPGDESLLNQRIGRFSCTSDLLPEYLFRCLQTTSFRRLVESSCEGSKIRHLYWRHIEGFSIPRASLQEQRRVVRRIATIDEAISATERELNTALSLKMMLREQLLGSGFDGGV